MLTRQILDRPLRHHSCSWSVHCIGSGRGQSDVTGVWLPRRSGHLGDKQSNAMYIIELNGIYFHHYKNDTMIAQSIIIDIQLKMGKAEV